MCMPLTRQNVIELKEKRQVNRCQHKKDAEETNLSMMKMNVMKMNVMMMNVMMMNVMMMNVMEMNVMEMKRVMWMKIVIYLI